MDHKIHIHFFPRDASRVRSIIFSRALGLALIFTALPLCLIGFWLVLSGTLHENPARKMERQKLERENRALRERTSQLQLEAEALQRNLDSLESARIHALMATGLATQETPRMESHRRFQFFHSMTGNKHTPVENLARDLKQAREASLFFDSSLFVLSRRRDLAQHFPTAFPVGFGGLVIRPFGVSADPFTGKRSMHAGVDFSQRPGAPVYAVGSGRVVESGQSPLWGNYVRIEHSARVETFYAHLHEIRVRNGEEVTRGQNIGSIGQTGSASGPHLHFEMQFQGERVDPLRFLLPPENKTGESPIL